MQYQPVARLFNTSLFYACSLALAILTFPTWYLLRPPALPGAKSFVVCAYFLWCVIFVRRFVWKLVAILAPFILLFGYFLIGIALSDGGGDPWVLLGLYIAGQYIAAYGGVLLVIAVLERRKEKLYASLVLIGIAAFVAYTQALPRVEEYRQEKEERLAHEQEVHAEHDAMEKVRLREYTSIEEAVSWCMAVEDVQLQCIVLLAKTENNPDACQFLHEAGLYTHCISELIAGKTLDQQIAFCKYQTDAGFQDACLFKLSEPRFHTRPSAEKLCNAISDAVLKQGCLDSLKNRIDF